MADLGPRRSQGIYNAVHDVLMTTRIEVAKRFRGHPAWDELDALLSKANHEAARAAVEAAGHDYRKTRRSR